MYKKNFNLNSRFFKKREWKCPFLNERKIKPLLKLKGPLSKSSWIDSEIIECTLNNSMMSIYYKYCDVFQKYKDFKQLI